MLNAALPPLDPRTAAPPGHAALRRKAEAVEAAFLAEMLGHAGLGALPGGFGGGPGEEHFASFLRHAQAESLVRQGGVGLAEQVFRALVRRAEG